MRGPGDVEDSWTVLRVQSAAVELVVRVVVESVEEELALPGVIRTQFVSPDRDGVARGLQAAGRQTRVLTVPRDHHQSEESLAGVSVYSYYKTITDHRVIKHLVVLIAPEPAQARAVPSSASSRNWSRGPATGL